eukprot:TRINITY_DN27503_c0_g1_i2.p1 TRINITY_DN27503_c0_g1~~TRINITY_DN27503_c0_g1_i2.p1  ORF type:complete len:488 (+),score=101.89 TRINITY_DN27503_c0_g1_i2:89-1465(+)
MHGLRGAAVLVGATAAKAKKNLNEAKGAVAGAAGAAASSAADVAGVAAGAAGVAAGAGVAALRTTSEVARLHALDAAEWASAKTLAAGSEALKKAQAVLKELIVAAYGSDVYEAMVAISECMEKVMGELGVSGAKQKFGLLMALPLVSLEHVSRPPPYSQGVLEDEELLEEACYWLDYADASYGIGAGSADKSDRKDPTVFVAKKLGGRARVLLAHLPPPHSVGAVQCPGHYVAVDEAHSAVVLCIRGTKSVSDAITNGVGHSVDVPECPGLQAHQGILASARAVLERTSSILTETLGSAPGIVNLVVCGHSLGAGTAILCALLLLKASGIVASERLRCFAFAPPAVVSSLDAPALADLQVYAFVNRYDIIPQLSMRTIYRLGLEAMAVDQLDLGLLTRLDLVRRGRSMPDTAEGKVRVVSAVEEASRSSASAASAIPAHFIPGRICWLEEGEQRQTL